MSDEPRTPMPIHPFVQITSTTVDKQAVVHALDSEGGVWKYCPQDKEAKRFAFWTKLTGHRRDAAERRE